MKGKAMNFMMTFGAKPQPITSVWGVVSSISINMMDFNPSSIYPAFLATVTKKVYGVLDPNTFRISIWASLSLIMTTFRAILSCIFKITTNFKNSLTGVARNFVPFLLTPPFAKERVIGASSSLTDLFPICPIMTEPRAVFRNSSLFYSTRRDGVDFTAFKTILKNIFTDWLPISCGNGGSSLTGIRTILRPFFNGFRAYGARFHERILTNGY